MKRVTIDIDDECGNGVIFITFCRGNDKGGIAFARDYIDLAGINTEITCLIRPKTIEEKE